MSLTDEIRSLRLNGRLACSDAIEWLETLGPDVTLAEAWASCPRADWLLWWCRATGALPSDPILRRLAVRWRTRTAHRQAELSGRPLDPRIEETLRIAAAYVEGKATKAELDTATNDAADAAYTTYASYAVANAAYASYAAAYAASLAAASASYAAAYAAAHAAASSSYAAAYAAAHAASASVAAACNDGDADELRAVWTPVGKVGEG